jgi:cell division inhibitor SepF
MSSLHKLKAYFGMVPVDQYDTDYADGYDGGYEDYPAEAERPVRYRAARPASPEHEDREPAYAGAAPEARAPRLEPLSTRTPVRRGTPSSSQPVTRGALAVDERPELREPQRRSNPFAEDGHPLAKITTLHPRTYNEARTIGERYREGNPVIMNLTEMSDSDAKRLVDFAAGLAFAMRGAIDKVTNKVFLLSPSDVDVSAEDKRRIVENGFYNQS